MNKLYQTVILLLYFLPIQTKAQDSIKHLNEVIVISKNAFRQTIPNQMLMGEELTNLTSSSVADALKFFAGLQIKDYGGIGGIKTVNIRSMGSQHVGVYYDGIQLGNAQNGQIDLGQFSLDNIEEISLYNGQKSTIIQTASDFINAGSIYLRTKNPHFHNNKTYNLTIRSGLASSSTYKISILWEQKLSQLINSSLNVEYLQSTGKYKFRYYRQNIDGSTAYDTTAVRENGDIWAFRIEKNINGTLLHGLWNIKLYTYNSLRGIPGAIVNNVWRRGERQADHNHFMQGKFLSNIKNKFTTQWIYKIAYYHTHYTNKDPLLIPVDNTYRQREVYIATSNAYEISNNISASLSYDLKYNNLDANFTDFSKPKRWSNTVAFATSIDLNFLKIQGSIANQWINDKIKNTENKTLRHAISPAFFINLYPIKSQDLSIRAFTKKSFRMPTFNDLYYTEIGNAKLNPETALQYNLGLSFNKIHNKGFWQGFNLQIDGYYNNVHDKIIAYPRGQQFRWTMLNLGVVHIKGMDISCGTGVNISNKLSISTRIQYTYQDAKDVTSKQDSYYDNQIPYIPWHSGTIIGRIIYKNLILNYSFIYVGKRYNSQENIIYNYMQPWYTSDLSISYSIKKKKSQYKISAQINNMFSQDYDIILNYPMPKRNYAISLGINI